MCLPFYLDEDRGMTDSTTYIQSVIARQLLDVLETISPMSWMGWMSLPMATMSHAQYEAHSHDKVIVSSMSDS